MNETVQVKQKKQLAEPVTVDGAVTAPAIAVAPASDGTGPVHRGITVEHALYGVILLVALGLRFFALGAMRPLSPLEAAQSWSAWLDAMGRPLDALAVPHSPLLYSVQRFLFWLTDGGNDAWARAFPALVGSLLVLAPWGLRSYLGRGGALILSLLLAVDPWLLAFSRTGDGAILAVTTGLVLWIGLLNWHTFDRLSTSQTSLLLRRCLAVVAGLFVISGPLAWLLLPPLLWTAWLIRPMLDPDRRERTWWLGLFAGTVLFGATGWLATLAGLGAISTSFSVALSYLTADSSYPLSWPFLRLLVDEPFLAIVGVAGLAVLWKEGGQRALRERGREGTVGTKGSGGTTGTEGTGSDSQYAIRNTQYAIRKWGYLLVGWAAYGLLLWLLPGRNPATLLVLSPPLLVAAASLAGRLLRFATGETDWQDGALIAITLTVLLITSRFLTAGYSDQIGAASFPWTALLFYLILPAVVAFFAWWSGWRTTAQIVSLVVLGGLFLATLSSSWTLNLRSDLLRGNQLYAVTSQPTVRLLAEDVARLSAIRSGDPTVAGVQVQVDDALRPLLGWYLRSMQNLRFVGAVDPAEMDRNTFVITQQMDAPVLPGGTVGSDYPATSVWLPTQLEAWNARLRWVLFRELREMPAVESVILWVQEE